MVSIWRFVPLSMTQLQLKIWKAIWDLRHFHRRDCILNLDVLLWEMNAKAFCPAKLKVFLRCLKYIAQPL